MFFSVVGYILLPDKASLKEFCMFKIISACILVLVLTTAIEDPELHKSQLKNFVNRKIVFMCVLIEILCNYVDSQNATFTACLPSIS